MRKCLKKHLWKWDHIDSINCRLSEVLIKKDSSFKADMLYLGIIFYLLLTNSHHYERFNKDNNHRKIQKIIQESVNKLIPEDIIPSNEYLFILIQKK